MSDLRTDRPAIAHRLAVAIRFVDPFTHTPVRVPLRASIASLRWDAVAVEPDATYRFVATNRPVPAGTFAVSVDVPGGEYASREPLTVQLPRPLGPPHPPPALRADFLVEAPLWPTEALRLPAGETVVVGRVVSASAASVDGFRVLLFTGAAPAPGAPYALTDADGRFVFRLPELKNRVVGGVLVSTAQLQIEVHDAANAAVTVTVPPGATLSLDLGRVTPPVRIMIP